MTERSRERDREIKRERSRERAYLETRVYQGMDTIKVFNRMCFRRSKSPSEMPSPHIMKNPFLFFSLLMTHDLVKKINCVLPTGNRDN